MSPLIDLNSYEHLGKGIAFPITINLQGGLQLSQTILNIEESIHLILSTSLGERLYRPDFGCRLSDLVFSPINTETLLQIKLYVEEALRQWEPRIELEDIITEPDLAIGLVNIHIRYFPKESHDLHSLVYPFYLSFTQE
ncbi:MAG: GPW/gp25 family protein [Cyanobacteria bacterium J06639_14]